MSYFDAATRAHGRGRPSPGGASQHTLAAHFLAKARALPTTDPLHIVADASVLRRLSSVTGWWKFGLEVLRMAGVKFPIKPALTWRPTLECFQLRNVPS